jgi:hypothetical protein
MNGTRTGLVLATLALVVGALPAHSQAARPQTRQGFWFGFGLGYGSICGEDCDDRAGSGSGYLKLGGSVSQKVLIGFEANTWIKSEDDVTVSQTNGSGVIYFYPSATGGFHLKAGIGFVNARVALDLGNGTTISSNETGGGGLLGLGYDIRVGRNISLVPFLNFLGGKYNDGETNFYQIGLGLTVH